MFGFFGHHSSKEATPSQQQQQADLISNSSALPTAQKEDIESIRFNPPVALNDAFLPEESTTDGQPSKEGKDAEALAKIYQLRAMYELTTDLAGKCFDRCVQKLGTTLSETEKTCINNCVARYFDMKLFFAHQILHSNNQKSE
jgi:hypothetical protein